MLVLERLVLLRVIDSLWVEHLTAVDDMRRGIGLRAYSQRDPLNEFKVEAYRMFDELKSTIRHDITHTVFRVTLTREPVQQRQPRPMMESRPDVTGAACRHGCGGGRHHGRQRLAAGEGRPEAGAQRPLLVRVRQEVQAVPRRLSRQIWGLANALGRGTMRAQDREA